jgi:hypothetical protein
MKKPDFDLVAAHRHFSAACFNDCWELIRKPARTPEEDEQMLLRTFASYYHWTRRPDCTAENRSIALWQISRVYALLGQAENARRYGEQCRAVSDDPALEPYCLGYAYEALARAEMVAGDREKMKGHLAKAHEIAGQMSDAEAQKMLLDDLATVS